jgi:isochorismate pyruvate lyase
MNNTVNNTASSGNNTASSEPRVDAPAVRRFTNAAYVPKAASLAEIRAAIDALDAQIINLIAERGRYVKDATRFKRDAFQVAAPARQAQVFERARLCAQEHQADLPTLPDVVEATYRTMVAAFVASEHIYFDQTRAIEEEE